MGDLLVDALSVAGMQSEIDRAVTVAGDAIDGDVYVQGDAASAADELSQYWEARGAEVQDRLDAH